MTPSLTREDSRGTTYLSGWAIPLVVAAICVPVILAMLLGMLAIEGTGLGLAAGALAVATLLVIAGRAKPLGKTEVAEPTDAERRLLVVASVEVTPEAAGQVARRAEGTVDVRLVVPVPSRRLDRWLSAEDDARAEAQRRLAHAAGALVAAGLPVSGSLGDSDPAQALEDELRGYSADEVVVLGDADLGPRLAATLERLELPVTTITL